MKQTQITLPETVMDAIRAETKQIGAEQYHEYLVTGGYGEPASVIDSTCNNNRVLTVDLANPGIEPSKLKRRAETEMRRERENRTAVTVSDWGLTDTQIKNLGETIRKEIFWAPNLLIPVSMPSLGLDANLLIAEIEQEADGETMSNTITLVNREAYSGRRGCRAVHRGRGADNCP
jgi:prophage tail gpP-like protein